MRKLHFVLLLFCFLQGAHCVFAADVTKEPEARVAQKPYEFIGEVSAEGINLRTDSTASSEIICRVNAREKLEVVASRYGWYKVRLPQGAPAFIKKDFLRRAQEDSAIVVRENVNIRLRADLASAILGKARKETVVRIVGQEGDWYQIVPIHSSFGWIHQKFVEKIQPPPEPARTARGNTVIVEGKLRAKTFTRVATHKLIYKEGGTEKIFLLKGNEDDFKSLQNHLVRVQGKIDDPSMQKFPILEVEKIEAID